MCALRSMMTETTASPVPGIARSEMPLWLGIVTTLVLMSIGADWFADLSDPLVYFALFAWLFAVMLWLSFAVVRHADCLAIKLGEPYGTLILTVSVISIEVIMIAAVMLTGDKSPTLGRDTLFSVVMIVLNGLLGLTLLIGALKYKEQSYNLQGASAYVGVLLPMAGLGLILPRFMTSAPGGQVSTLQAVYLLITSLALYGAFLGIQMTRHRGYFRQPETALDGDTGHAHQGLVIRSIRFHAVLLPLTMLPIVLLSKKMAVLVDHGIGSLGAPLALGGFFVAILVLTPEAVAAVKAALANQLQRTINIALGSALATIGLTIPAVLAIGLVTGMTIELGLEEPELYLLLITLLCAIHNLNSQRTNVMHGIVHLVLFFTYVILIFD
ncbi:MAG: calcium:proton antiporter [Chromatiales bacterium]